MRQSVFLGSILFVLLIFVGLANLYADNDNWHFRLEGVPTEVVAGSNYKVKVYFIPVHHGADVVFNDGSNVVIFFVLDIQFDSEFLQTKVLDIKYDAHEITDANNITHKLWAGGIAAPTEVEPGWIRRLNGAWPPAVNPDPNVPDPPVYRPDRENNNNHLATITFQAIKTGTPQVEMKWVNPGSPYFTVIESELFEGDPTIDIPEKFGADKPVLVWQEELSIQNRIAVNGSFFYRKYLGLEDDGEDTFPRVEAHEAQYSGVSSALQALLFLDPDTPWPTQASLHGMYHSDTQVMDLTPDELAKLLNDETAKVPSLLPYNFSHLSSSDQDTALKTLIHWIDYRVPGVNQPNAPAHIPIGFDRIYSWMTVRAFSSNESPTVDGSSWALPPNLVVRGLWLNNPRSGDNTNIGHNHFVEAAHFKNSYYFQVLGAYRLVAEPPLPAAQEELERNLDKVEIQFAEGEPNPELASALKAKRDLETEEPASSLLGFEGLDAAVQLQAQLTEIDYEKTIPRELMDTPDFAQSYSGSHFNDALLIHDLDKGSRYNLLLFGKGHSRNGATVAIVVDEENATFLEASWVPQEVEYLSKRRAQELAYQALDKDLPVKRVELVTWWKRSIVRESVESELPIEAPARLVWSQELCPSVFQPTYEIETPFGPTVYVGQNGGYTIEGELDPAFIQEEPEPEPEGPLASEEATTGNEAALAASANGFESKALTTLPLKSVVAFPQEIDASGAFRPAEVWLRVEEGFEAQPGTLMLEAASLYREETGYTGLIKISLWVESRLIQSSEY